LKTLEETLNGILARRGLATTVVLVSAGLWGLFWIPLRYLEKSGVPPQWSVFLHFFAPTAVMLPFVIYRLLHARRTGLKELTIGFTIGGSFVLYFESLLLTDIVRSLLLFYLTPVWGSLLECAVLKRRLTMSRTLALTLGITGLIVILDAHTGIPSPRNIGDLLALAGGIVWAIGTFIIRVRPHTPVFEHLFSTFAYGAIISLSLAILPILPHRAFLPLESVISVIPLLLIFAAVFLIPIMWGLLTGADRIDPGRLGILLQMEAIVGIGTAAMLSGEPYGPQEVVGTILIVGAGLVDIIGPYQRK